MTVLTHASREELEAIVQEFAALTWPAEASIMSQIATRLGWIARVEAENTSIYRIPFGGMSSRATASLSGGNLNEVSINVSERVDPDDSAQNASMKATFAAVRSVLVDLLGDPVRVRGGEVPRVTWDLPNRGRVAVQNLGAVVQVVVLQEHYADIERFEESRGIADDRDPRTEVP